MTRPNTSLNTPGHIAGKISRDQTFNKAENIVHCCFKIFWTSHESTKDSKPHVSKDICARGRFNMRGKICAKTKLQHVFNIWKHGIHRELRAKTQNKKQQTMLITQFWVRSRDNSMGQSSYGETLIWLIGEMRRVVACNNRKNIYAVF